MIAHDTIDPLDVDRRLTLRFTATTQQLPHTAVAIAGQLTDFSLNLSDQSAIVQHTPTSVGQNSRVESSR